MYGQYYYNHHILRFLKSHLHCFANRLFLVTGSIGCLSLASGCGVVTLTGTCVPLPVLFSQIKNVKFYDPDNNYYICKNTLI